MNINEILPDFQMTFDFDETVKQKVVPTAKPTLAQLLENLGERQRMVYNYLKSTYIEGATAKELAVAMFREGLVRSPERNSVHPRLNELIAVDLIKVVGKKTCQYTGKRVSIYKLNK